MTARRCYERACDFCGKIYLAATAASRYCCTRCRQMAKSNTARMHHRPPPWKPS